MLSIAVLLTVFNRREKTLECLHNLYMQDLPKEIELEVFLTDDGCTDGTPDAIRTKFPQVKIVEGDGSLFWNRGMYKAWQFASETKNFDFYLWLNDDTFVYPKMIDCLFKASQNKSHRAIIVGATQSTDRTQVTYGGRSANGKLIVPNGQIQQISHFNGNIVLIPRSVYLILGNLDNYFTHSKGDFDYGMRALKAGIEMFQVGEYLGECDLHQTLDKWCDPKMPFYQRWKMLHRPNGMPPNEIYYFNLRHKGIISAIIHYITVYLRCLFPSLWSRRNNKILNHK